MTIQWTEPSPWKPLVYHLNIDAGNYQVVVTARHQLSDSWTVTVGIACDWGDVVETAWMASSLDLVLDDVVAMVEDEQVVNSSNPTAMQVRSLPWEIGTRRLMVNRQV